MLHMRGTPGGMGAGLSPNALVLPERLKSMPLLTLGEPAPRLLAVVGLGSGCARMQPAGSCGAVREAVQTLPPAALP